MLLEFKNVAKHYDAPPGHPPIPILSDLSFQLSPGETLAIVGPSGSGKSTLLNLIGALDTPSSGQVLLDGHDLSRCDDHALAALRNRTLGFIFQSHHLLPQLTLLENVLVPTLAGHPVAPPAELEARARRLLHRVGLQSRLDHRPGQLSGGECQRAAVVRALVNHPKLILADEPTGALDLPNAHALGSLLLELNREENVALVLVTHWPELAARMSRVLSLRQGRLLPAAA